MATVCGANIISREPLRQLKKGKGILQTGSLLGLSTSTWYSLERGELYRKTVLRSRDFDGRKLFIYFYTSILMKHDTTSFPTNNLGDGSSYW